MFLVGLVLTLLSQQAFYYFIKKFCSNLKSANKKTTEEDKCNLQKKERIKAPILKMKNQTYY
jgi:phosphotransferase system  glucose/maltose/N-acetylglucosamine-specific IIC component